MLATLIAVSLAAQAPSPADFFPLVAGTRRTYEERSNVSAVSVDEVGAPMDFETGGKAIPVTTREGGREISKMFYRIEGDTLYVVASDPKHPLPQPFPILQIKGEKTNWVYSGPSDDTKYAETVSMTGESRLLPPRDVLGKKLPVLEVKLSTTVGAGNAQEKSDVVATYAKGVGLIQATTKTKVGKHSATNELKLVKVEEAKTDG